MMREQDFIREQQRAFRNAALVLSVAIGAFALLFL